MTNYQPYNGQAADKIYNLLFEDRGLERSGNDLSAVILEVGLDKGLDVLAAFINGTARYINQSGKMIIWESPTPGSDVLIKLIFEQGRQIVNKIGPWDGDRRPPPEKGMIRLNFIAGKQLYFGEGPFQSLYNDAMAKPVIDAGLQLMQFLISKAG